MRLYYNASSSCICAQAHDVHASLSNTTCATNENVPDTDTFTAQHDFNKFFFATTKRLQKPCTLVPTKSKIDDKKS